LIVSEHWLHLLKIKRPLFVTIFFYEIISTQNLENPAF
jgi:hypothetical protein